MESVALFVYVPFCRTHCTYCDFSVYTHLRALQEPYVQAVTREIESVAGAQNIRGLNAHSVYFGGGTPSILSAEQIARMLDACAHNFTLMPDAEITVEVNPGTVDLDKLIAFRRAGVNRLSIGIESFDDALLKRVARLHTTADSLTTYKDARRAGFDNVNLDFIYGWMNQTLAEWNTTLDRALQFAPEHLSLYGLQIEDSTALQKQIAKGIYPQPDNDLSADMYLLADEKLADAGYRHYEISNWARDLSPQPSFPFADGEKALGYLSRHNLTYWLDEPYLGFGAGAHSSWRGERYANVLPPRDYIAQVTNGTSAVGMRETIERELEMGETMMVGLRLDVGVECARFRTRFGIEAREKYATPIAQLQARGLLEADVSSIRLTRRGRLVSNQVLWRFLPDK